MSEPSQTSTETCAICDRTLLLGERAFDYVDGEGQVIAVCQLCKPRAEAAGFLPPNQAGGERATRGGSRRRGSGDLLGGLLGGLGRQRGAERRTRGRPAEQHGEAAEAPATVSGEDSESEAGPSDGEATAGRRPADPARVQAALDCFNASDGPRTVAGLARSLGPPQASVVAVRSTDGAAGARLTVAWELAWYQWVVQEGKRGPVAERSAKGEHTDQLREADRHWNLETADDGTLSRLRRASE